MKYASSTTFCNSCFRNRSKEDVPGILTVPFDHTGVNIPRYFCSWRCVMKFARNPKRGAANVKCELGKSEARKHNIFKTSGFMSRRKKT